MLERKYFPHQLVKEFSPDIDWQNIALLKEHIGLYNETWYECVYCGDDKRICIAYCFKNEELAMLARLILPGMFIYKFSTSEINAILLF